MIRYFILFQIYAPGGSTKGNASMKVGAFFLSIKTHEFNAKLILFVRY